MWQWIGKRIAIFRYRTKLGPALADRYGRRRRYTPPQVLTTIELHALNKSYAAYACVMYCSRQAYSAFVAQHASKPYPLRQSVVDDSWLLWAFSSPEAWPAYPELEAALGGRDASRTGGSHAHSPDASNGPDEQVTGYDHAGGDSHVGGDHGYGGGAGGDAPSD
jgi:hypothetical protein